MINIYLCDLASSPEIAKNMSIGITLSGGGATGIAHIGELKSHTKPHRRKWINFHLCGLAPLRENY